MKDRRHFFASVALCLVALLLAFQTNIQAAEPVTKIVKIPEGDRFIPFVLTIHVGDTVKWINNDEDDHTVVAVTHFTTTDHNTVNHRILGLENNGDKPGVYQLTFHQAGRFTYHCRFHSTVDTHFQPKAPGPDGGVQDPNGNFGTPMMGVIEVLPVQE